MNNLKTKLEAFVNKNVNIFVSIIFFIIGGFVLNKFLGINTFCLYTIGISAIVILILGRIKVTEYLFSTISVIIIVINLIIVVLSLVPTYNKNVNVTGFYQQNKNYAQIDIQDDTGALDENKAKIIILNKGTINGPKREYRLNTPNIKDKQIELYTGDIVLFQSKSKTLNSVVNIYLWDGSIIRLMPQTTVKLQKVLKNTKDLFSSQTEVELQKGSIWFNIIKTIKDDNSFRIKTNEGTIVIRGTAGFVDQSSNNEQMTIYSMNHIIQLIGNDGKSQLIGKLESMMISGDTMQSINLSQLSDLIGQDYVQKIKNQSFSSMDKQDIDEFKNKLKGYATQEFGWIFDNQNSLEKIGEFKLQIFSMMDNSYQNALDNLNKYQLIKEGGSNNELDKQGRQELINNLINLQNQQDMIFVPANEGVEQIKMNFLKNSASYNFEQFKTYLITSYNKLLDQGKQVDLNKIQEMLDSGKGDIKNTLFELENKLQQLGN